MQLAIYSKDEGGLVTFRGVQDWDSVNECLEYYCRADEEPDTERMLGWPDAEVTWYRETGIAIRG